MPAAIAAKASEPFPQDPWRQLESAIEAVLDSWMGKRAVDYRREFDITDEMANGTAVNICTMVFGNKGDDCATGVGFTRNPGTGDKEMFGEYLTNAQGEATVTVDVVEPLAGEFRVNSAVDYEQERPTMAMDDDGDFVVTWWHVGDEYPIYARKYDRFGQPSTSQSRQHGGSN